MTISEQLAAHHALTTPKRPRRRSFIRYLPGDRSKSWKPRGLIVGGLRIPLPFFGGPA
jgi:hypothetical protein